MKKTNNQQPTTHAGYLRIWDIVGDKKRGIDALLPIGRSTFLARVRSGEYPAGLKLGPKTTVWPRANIIELLEKLGGGAQ
jgi:prophage regulatory protein